MVEGRNLLIVRPQREMTNMVHTASNLCSLPYKHQQLKYMHRSFFSLPIHTMSEAVNNNQLEDTLSQFAQDSE